LLRVLMERKMRYVKSLKGAKYDLVEFGGGDASSTVISPKVFDQFVAPYDAPLIAEAHAVGQRVVYHTCGGMMHFLERLVDMQPDALETFTPVGMGGDTRLAEAKKRVGDRVCMIGGGYILAPSDHFFDADLELLCAFAEEARNCVY
jgi:uroporphyrinogen decarboxylase